jgi:cytochrome c-type biogenesis protein CcmH/NrfG
LRRSLAQLPDDADLHHSLGPLLVRKGDLDAAVGELALTAQFAPDNVHYSYVYAVALHSAGQGSKALEVLRAADVRHPDTPDIPGTLVSINREAGDIPAALRYARKLVAALPDDPAVQRLVEELEGSK